MATRSPRSPSADGDAPPIDVDTEVDALYAADPEGFTVARDSLAKRLRAAGRNGEAAEVKALRRPTVAAWAVNHIARKRARDVTRLRELGSELRRAQGRALRRRTDDDTANVLRDLGARRRALVAELADAALAVLASRDGAAPDSHRADIVATFDAVVADDDSAEQVAAARLARPLEAPVGFGAPAGDDDAEIVVLDDDSPRRSPPKNRAKANG
ncbi:MAG TPA: hypothetical protein VGB03_05390, partial [Acidimicrobiales bacterium]